MSRSGDEGRGQMPRPRVIRPQSTAVLTGEVRSRGQFWVVIRVVKKGQLKVVIRVVKRGQFRLVIRVVERGSLVLWAV